MEGRNLIILAVGVLVVVVIALVAAFVVLNNGSPEATPTPAPEATPAAAAGTPTTGAGPTAKPVTGTATPAPGGPVLMETNYNRTMNICFVSLYLNTGASPVDTSNLRIDVVSGGQTYRSVWAPKAADWAGSNGNALLEKKEALTTQIDTKALGIPQGQAITIQVMQGDNLLVDKTVSPT